jgi:hypothetical protein
LRHDLLGGCEGRFQAFDVELELLGVNGEDHIALLHWGVRLRRHFQDPPRRRDMRHHLDNALEHPRIGR